MIEENLKKIREKLPKETKLVVVSKYHTIDEIMQAYGAGCRDFGENKIQDMTQKWEELPKDIRWHMIGHTQTNKVKYMAPYVHMIQSVDSLKLACEIDKQARKNNRVIDCLLQVHVAVEETKFGFEKQELLQLLKEEKLQELKSIKIRGIMGMATNTMDKKQIEREFKCLREIYEQIKDMNIEGFEIDTLSMGMSSDYEIAIECGSNLVRVGSAVFQ